MRKKLFLGSVIVALGVIALVFMGVQQSSSRHMTLDRLLTESGGALSGRIQLAGCTVVPGSIQWDEYHHRPEFQITDGDRELAVRYTGNAVLPDTFQDRAQVVMEGHWVPETSRFEAEVVMAKCPSKYEGQSYEDHQEALGEPTTATGT